MNSRVKITEEDLTSTAASLNVDVDVVYIPGFAFPDGQEKTNAKPFEPTLCKSLTEFKLKFGSKPATFNGNQKYPVASAVERGFNKASVPTPKTGETEVIWFENGASDISYVYACELLLKGIPVMFEMLNETKEDVTIENFYNQLVNKVYAEDCEISNIDYSVKYLTAGGYPILEYGTADALTDISENIITKRMASIAATRGECIALFDPTNKPERALVGNDSVFGRFIDVFSGSENGSYGQVTAPVWTNILLNGSNYGSITSDCNLPGSFDYLSALATSLQYNPAWLAVSGVSRGILPNVRYLCSDKKLTNAIADSYQLDKSQEGSSINSITYVNGYGYCIWGNRTARHNMLSKTTGYATSFLNIRNMLCDIKKQVQVAAQSLLFEPNTSATWLTFTSLITPLLDRMVSGSGLKDYKIIQQDVDDSRTKISAIIKLYPVYSVEEFEIAIQISDSDVTVE